MKHVLSVTVGVLFAALSASAATIFPKTPTLSGGCYEISDARELYGFAAIVNGTDGNVKNKSACGKLTVIYIFKYILIYRFSTSFIYYAIIFFL